VSSPRGGFVAGEGFWVALMDRPVVMRSFSCGAGEFGRGVERAEDAQSLEVGHGGGEERLEVPANADIRDRIWDLFQANPLP